MILYNDIKSDPNKLSRDHNYMIENLVPKVFS